MTAVLITGGAGFIGSHLTRRLVAERFDVRVLDNFSTGRRSNLADLQGVDLQQGDIRSRSDVANSMRGIEAVFHLAALPSVQRSWEDPVSTLATNALGTATVVEEAEAAGVSAFIYSSSSSVYGDNQSRKKTESLEPRPISPYGYSKLLGEKIALAHARGATAMRVVALRYFNIFGPRQDPESPYAAVVPLFIKHAINGTTAPIYGDGSQCRDFTYVDNAVDANLRAFRSDASGLALNIACGESHSLIELVSAISAITEHPLRTIHLAPRSGDIHHSQADISLAAKMIGYQPSVQFADGLRRAFDEYESA